MQISRFLYVPDVSYTDYYNEHSHIKWISTHGIDVLYSFKELRTVRFDVVKTVGMRDDSVSTISFKGKYLNFISVNTNQFIISYETR